MTDEELIEELSEMGRHPCRAHLPMGETLRQAADRIEAQAAEIERLREHLISALDTLKDAEVCNGECAPCNEALAALEQSK